MKSNDKIDKLLKLNLSGALNQKSIDMCPAEDILADYTAKNLPLDEIKNVECHISGCKICLEKISLSLKADTLHKQGQLNPAPDIVLQKAKKIASKTKPSYGRQTKKNLWLLAALIAFSFSFVLPKYFLQCLAATVLLGVKWIVESENMRTLILVLDSWRKHEHYHDEDISQRLADRHNNNALKR